MSDPLSPSLPVRLIPGDDKKQPRAGIGLCLSGGGYRAMVFHLGALIRLNELGFLPKLDRISSVSGGSITAGFLGLKWNALEFDGSGVASNLVAEVVTPIRAMATHTLDVGGVIGAMLLPGTVAEHIAKAYSKYLFGDSTLQDLPNNPRFVINATNIQTGSLWRFSKPYMADYKVGQFPNPTIALAVAVGASSAFPPVLSPVRLDLDPAGFTPGTGLGLQKPPYTTQVILTDGGAYDNLGLETVLKEFDTVLVSDGGLHISPEPEPHTDWARQALRVNDIIDSQVRDLHQRDLINAYKSGQRKGTYWATRSDIANYSAPNQLPCPLASTEELASIPTRLAGMDDLTQQRLINWGYAICDAAIRTHVMQGAAAPQAFPYPAVGV